MVPSWLVATYILANYAQFSIALNVEGRVSWNDVCPGYSNLGHSKVVLDDGKYFAGIRRDGSFSIPNVEEGSYILNVIAHDYSFDPLRIDIPPSPDAQSRPEVRPYVPGTPHNPPSTVILPYPISLAARAKAQYFVERQSFNALGMLQNPMMLMMVVTGVLVLAMPYIMKNLDPELAKEVSERQARYANIQNSLVSGDLRQGLAGLMGPELTAEHAGTPGSASTRKSGTGTGSSGRGRGGSARGGKRR